MSLGQAERCTLVVYTKWVLLGLVFMVGLYAASVFLMIFRADLSISAVTATRILEGISALLDDMVGFGMSVWAMGKLAKQL